VIAMIDLVHLFLILFSLNVPIYIALAHLYYRVGIIDKSLESFEQYRVTKTLLTVKPNNRNFLESPLKKITK